MLEYMKQEANLTLTENGAVTHSTTGSDCLDLFATIGALRQASDEEIITRFLRAYAENADIAMKLLFYARDIRGGLGERRVFRTIFNWLAKNEPASVKKNLQYVAEYGRFDDLLSLFDTPCEREMLTWVKKQLENDMDNLAQGKKVSLLAKWLPSVNASNEQTIRQGKKIAKVMGMNDAAYRRTLTMLRAKIHIIENDLREKDYSFDYEKQTSRSMFKYKQAFIRNDGERYSAFLERVMSGSAKLHAGNVMPYEVVEECMSEYFWRINLTQEKKDSLNATWESLPDFGGDENAIAVIDNSGSMYGGGRPLPASVAMSLGMYFAEHNKGRFWNYFITFSEKPKLLRIQGRNFVDKLRYVESFSEVADTNLEAVFDLILNMAVKHHVPQEELPAKLVIISDMEFNYCVMNASATNFENAKQKFAAAGYQLPEIVFWNVSSRNEQQPVTMNEEGVVLVSGMTPRLFSMVAGKNLSPYAFMMDVLNSERYAVIAA